MVKGSGASYIGVPEPFLFTLLMHKTKGEEEKMEKSVKGKERDVIAYRKRCKADGTGLSHYILMDKKGK